MNLSYLLTERWFWLGLAAAIAIILFLIDIQRSWKQSDEDRNFERWRRDYGRNK